MYTNHTGGAKGADATWKELGKPHGVNTIDWRPHHVARIALGDEKYNQMIEAVKSAAEVLKRPWQFPGDTLVHRNYLQPLNAQAIYAVSYIIAPGEIDFKGFENKTGKEIVAGGTGWAVEMAIQMKKPVYVYDMSTDHWYKWDSAFGRFFELPEAPTLTTIFAGIGSRFLTPKGYSAIDDVYKKTFKYE